MDLGPYPELGNRDRDVFRLFPGQDCGKIGSTKKSPGSLSFLFGNMGMDYGQGE